MIQYYLKHVFVFFFREIKQNFVSSKKYFFPQDIILGNNMVITKKDEKRTEDVYNPFTV